MERYIGIDVHAASCTLAVISEEGLQSAWLYETLNPHVDDTVVAGITTSRGQKSAKIDAYGLAEKLRVGNLAKHVFKAPRQFTRLRELSRSRMTLVSDTVRVQSRIKALYRSRGILVSGTNVYGIRHREQWQKQLPSSIQTRATRLYEYLDLLLEQKKQAEAHLLREAKKHPVAKILETAPGFGPIRAARLVPIVVTPHRFRTKRQFWSFRGLQPIDPATVERVGRRAIAIELGQWLAFQLSIWHEIATWFGWSSISAFPEKVSAFSPEDMYSNMIGTRIAAAIASQRTARDETLYNRSVDEWLDRMLSYLDAVPADVGREAMRSVDGLWWDSAARLPDARLVLRRNLDVGSVVTPWLIPLDRMGPELAERCGSQPQALPMANPELLAGPKFSERASLSIEISEELAGQEPFRRLGGRITQLDFPEILEAIRAQNRAEFGEDADRPG